MFIVTGANGFIGSALVWELNQKGISDILCVDHISTEERSGPLKGKKYSSFQFANDFIEKIKNNSFPSEDVQCIFHIGACSSTTEMDREYLKENNTLYTQYLFEYCRDHKIPFIYASSGAVYGDGTKGFNDKDSSDQFTALNPYGESKLNFDVWAEKQDSTPEHWYGLRFFNVYGPNEYHKESMASVVFKAFNQITQNGNLKLFKSHNPDYEDGRQLRDFVYVKDITRWMFELYENKTAKNGVYNLGFGNARSWLDLAENVFLNLGKEKNIEWIDIPENIRDQYQYFTEANITKLSEQGLSKPQWSLEDGIKDYVQNHLAAENSYL